MYKEADLPSTYKPFEKIILCSNELNNCKNIITIDGTPPFMIGKGNKPMIWLYAVKVIADKKIFKSVIEESISSDERIRVVQDDEFIIIWFANIILLKVKKVTDNYIIIPQLDLRPVGINAYGDESQLHIGNMHLSRNKFNDLDAIIKFGAREVK